METLGVCMYKAPDDLHLQVLHRIVILASNTLEGHSTLTIKTLLLSHHGTSGAARHDIYVNPPPPPPLLNLSLAGFRLFLYNSRTTHDF